jgi:hypothetical protein
VRKSRRKEAQESRQEEAQESRQEEAQESRQEETKESRQRGRKGAGQEEARESHHILPGVLKSVREYEGVNPHTPKATPILGNGVSENSQNFRKRLQGSKLNGL